MRYISSIRLASLIGALITLTATAHMQSTIPAPPDVAAPPATATKTASGLASRVIKPGTGKAHPAKSDMVTVHYTGWTTDGKMFDSSKIGGGMPATFPLDRVIGGWTEGVQLMVAGETRRLWIPEALAYKGRARSERHARVRRRADFLQIGAASTVRRQGAACGREKDRERSRLQSDQTWDRRATSDGRPTKSPSTIPAGRPTGKCSTAR